LLKQGALKGLSIGYDVVKDNWEKRIRYLKELKLWEVSVVTFPCNTLAGTTSVKAQTFSEILASKNLRQQYWDIQDALGSAVYCVMNNEANDDDETRINALASSVDQYKAAVMEWFGKYIAQKAATEKGVNIAEKGTEPEELKAILEDLNPDSKAGRVLSNTNATLLKNALAALSALLQSAATEEDTVNNDDSTDGDSSKDHSKSDDGKKGLGDINDIKKLMEEMTTFTKNN
jgi:hypothetical protein